VTDAKPCPAEAAATLLDELAADLERGPVTAKARDVVATKLECVPILHVLRDWPVDRVLDMARAVRHGRPEGREEPTPAGLRAFADELRAGAPAMRERGWFPGMRGRNAS
jgi:hypothetical protein